LDPRFAVSNPAEGDGFLIAIKIYDFCFKVLIGYVWMVHKGLIIYKWHLYVVAEGARGSG
jgi:hypothetical protein